MARIINTYGDNALEISQEQIANTLQVGSNWTHMRLGFLSTVSASVATSSITSIIFAAGLCSGTASLFGSTAGPTYFAGMFTLSTANWVSSGVQSNNAYTINPTGANNDDPNNGHIPPKIGVIALTNTLSQSFVTDWAFLGVSTGSLTSTCQSMTATYIDFIKTVNNTTPQNWNIRFYHWHGVNGAVNPMSQSKVDFYGQLSNITASFTNQGAASWLTDVVTLPISESTFGTLDSVNIQWSKNMPFHIHEIALYKFA